MVSNEDIKKRLSKRRSGEKIDSNKTLVENEFYCPECGSKIPTNVNFCSECGSKLDLPAYISSSKTEDDLDKENIKCPVCLTENSVDEEICLNCGKNLNETLGFFKGGISSSGMKKTDDIEITLNEIIIYPRGVTGGRKRKIKKYSRENVQNVKIGKYLGVTQLRFYYKGKLKVQPIRTKYTDELSELLELNFRKGLLKEARGYNGILELYEHKIIIRRKGLKSFITQGWKGDKEILINHISSIQFKKPGAATNGYIQFAFLGGTEDKKGLFDATKDENSIIFTHKQEDNFVEIKEMIESKLIEQQGIKNSTSSETGGFSDLEKLAELKDKGIITEEEFEAKKKQILGL